MARANALQSRTLQGADADAAPVRALAAYRDFRALKDADADIPNSLIAGLGDRVHEANSNFAPQLGFAWDPTGDGKTVIRSGIGLFYENVLAAVAPSDPIARSATGDVFTQVPPACYGTAQPAPVPIQGGTLNPMFCGTASGGAVAIGVVADRIAAFQRLYQADSPFNLNVPNPNYAGSLVSNGLALGGAFGTYDP